MTYFIGIDPGLTGAVAVIGDSFVDVYDIPTVANGAGRVKSEVSGLLLAQLIRRLGQLGSLHALLERTASMPGQGVASMFSMGVSRGVVLGVLGALAVPYIEAAPATWKKAYGLIGADKDQSRRVALQLYPSLATQLARVKDHNRAEAVLLADYLKRSAA